VNRNKKMIITTVIFGSNLLIGAEPNIVYILADDLGFGDVKCNNPNGKILTPAIDKLAKEGVSFTDAHSAAAVCTPSRYAIMTGRYPWRTKLKSGVLKTTVTSTGKVGSEPLIKANVLTVGKFLQQNNYDTAMFGKWHLGMWYQMPKGKSILKKKSGASSAPIGTIINDGPITRGFDKFKGFHHAREMGTWISQDKVVENIQPKEMLGKITDASIKYIKDSKRKNKPFFVYIPLNSPHTPIVPNNDWIGKSGINKYADYVMETDNAIGKIIKAIDEAGLKDNTLVIFTADNGCSHKANFKQLLAAGHDPSGGFRGSKSDLWEGGHRVPFIARWPETIKANSRCKDPICLSSLMATVSDILGKELPKEAGVDSFSILPDFKDPNNKTATHPVIIHQSIKGKLGVRKGKWKFLACEGSGGWGKGGDGQPYQLYDMELDSKETTNLLNKSPEIVSTLKKELTSDVKKGFTVPNKSGKNDTPVTIGIK
jgi:arylsulfatase A-like enzyme